MIPIIGLIRLLYVCGMSLWNKVNLLTLWLGIWEIKIKQAYKEWLLFKNIHKEFKDNLMRLRIMLTKPEQCQDYHNTK